MCKSVRFGPGTEFSWANLMSLLWSLISATQPLRWAVLDIEVGDCGKIPATLKPDSYSIVEAPLFRSRALGHRGSIWRLAVSVMRQQIFGVASINPHHLPHQRSLLTYVQTARKCPADLWVMFWFAELFCWVLCLRCHHKTNAITDSVSSLPPFHCHHHHHQGFGVVLSSSISRWYPLVCVLQ